MQGSNTCRNFPRSAQDLLLLGVRMPKYLRSLAPKKLPGLTPPCRATRSTHTTTFHHPLPLGGQSFHLGWPIGMASATESVFAGHSLLPLSLIQPEDLAQHWPGLFYGMRSQQYFWRVIRTSLETEWKLRGEEELSCVESFKGIKY